MTWLVAWWGATAGAADDPCADAAAAAQWTAEVQAAYEAGEQDRPDRSPTATSVLARDEERVKQALALADKGRLCTALAKWQAAWLLLQSDEPDVLERAVELARQSTQGGEKRGPWLTAYAFDTWRVAGGYRQSYGSQTQVTLTGHRCLVEIEPDVTDDERRQFGMPALAETYRKILDLNGFTAEPATLERLERHQLYCKPEAASKKAQRRVRPPDP
jgi:hypothetical protein